VENIFNFPTSWNFKEWEPISTISRSGKDTNSRIVERNTRKFNVSPLLELSKKWSLLFLRFHFSDFQEVVVRLLRKLKKWTSKKWIHSESRRAGLPRSGILPLLDNLKKVKNRLSVPLLEI
jgi:hypothetical protein